MRQQCLHRAAEADDEMHSWEETVRLDSLGALSARLASFSRSA